MFRAYRPPPRNASRDMVNAIAPLAGGILGAAAGAAATSGSPQGAMAGYQAGSGLGQSIAGLTQGGPDMEQRVASGSALAAQGIGSYMAGQKQYGTPQVGEAKSGTDVTRALSPTPMPAATYTREPNDDAAALEEQAWRYKGLPIAAKRMF